MATEARPGSLQWSRNGHDLAGSSSLPQAPSCHRLFVPAAPEGGSFPHELQAASVLCMPPQGCAPTLSEGCACPGPPAMTLSSWTAGRPLGSAVMVGPAPGAPGCSTRGLQGGAWPPAEPHGPDQPGAGRPGRGAGLGRCACVLVCVCVHTGRIPLVPCWALHWGVGRPGSSLMERDPGWCQGWGVGRADRQADYLQPRGPRLGTLQVSGVPVSLPFLTLLARAGAVEAAVRDKGSPRGPGPGQPCPPLPAPASRPGLPETAPPRLDLIWGLGGGLWARVADPGVWKSLVGKARGDECLPGEVAGFPPIQGQALPLAWR